MVPTFLTLPLEIRHHIYSLTGCLNINQVSEIAETFQAIDDESKKISIKLPKCSDGCFPRLRSTTPKPLSIWINRRSELGRKEFHSPNYPTKKHLRKLFPTHKAGNKWQTALHGPLHTDRVAQPALTKVNKQTRIETLQLFYGSQSFLFTLFYRDTDSVSIFKWLRTIGKNNASFLRTVKIVYRKKQDVKFIRKTLLPAMNRLGVRTEAKQDVVVAIRLTYPFCYCEECIRTLLGEG